MLFVVGYIKTINTIDKDLEYAQDDVNNLKMDDRAKTSYYDVMASNCTMQGAIDDKLGDNGVDVDVDVVVDVDDDDDDDYDKYNIVINDSCILYIVLLLYCIYYYLLLGCHYVVVVVVTTVAVVVNVFAAIVATIIFTIIKHCVFYC